ncbi:MAG: polysaccharide deacetylase family protein [Bacteroidota bacterium]
MKQATRFTVYGILIILLLLVLGLFYSRSWERALFIEPYFRIQTEDKLVALTFDDGPSPQRTLPLLRLLQEKEVKATFFMLGENIEKHDSIARKVFEEGHLIGNHSYDHPRLILRSVAFTRDQIVRTDRLIQRLGQKEVRYFRPPYSSKYIILPILLRSMNKILVTGTYDPPSEYKSPYDGQQVAQEVMENVQPGSVIYLHDGIHRDPEAFIQSVDLIIDSLRASGYRFVRLDVPSQ